MPDLHPDPFGPLDSVIRARLHWPRQAKVRLWLLRSLAHSVDGISRTFTGQPFFALKEAEALLNSFGDIHGDELIQKLLAHNGGCRIDPEGLAQIPRTGPVIIASTHSTGLFDFIAHAAVLHDLRPDLKLVANQEVEAFLGPDYIVPVPISKRNRALKTEQVYAGMTQHLSQGGALLIFGSGRVPKMVEGMLVEPAWRHGASNLSRDLQVPVVPAAVEARNSGYYYRLRDAAERLRGGNDSFGAMVGSMRYIAELLWQLGGSFRVHYGTPILPGSPPDVLQSKAEGLVPDLYAPAR